MRLGESTVLDAEKNDQRLTIRAFDRRGRDAPDALGVSTIPLGGAIGAATFLEPPLDDDDDDARWYDLVPPSAVYDGIAGEAPRVKVSVAGVRVKV